LQPLLDNLVELPAVPVLLRVHLLSPFLIVEERAVEDVLMPIRESGPKLLMDLLPGVGPDLHPALLVGKLGIGAKCIRS